MGKDDKYYKSAGKIVKIKCRVESCQKVMLRQRYRNHLVECHPGENSRDLREYEHRSMSINKYLGSGNARSKENSNLRLMKKTRWSWKVRQSWKIR